MYIYIQTEPQVWTVGHYWSDGRFHPESDHGTPDEAAKRVNYLNGGCTCQCAKYQSNINKQNQQQWQ